MSFVKLYCQKINQINLDLRKIMFHTHKSIEEYRNFPSVKNCNEKYYRIVQRESLVQGQDRQTLEGKDFKNSRK